MDEITRDFDFVYAYIDEFLITSENEEQHHEHWRILFKHLNEYGVVIYIAKCEFDVSEIKFLATPVTSDDFILTIWEGRLPVHVQHILDAMQDKSPETLTRIAGSIYEIHPEPGQVVAVSTDRMTAVSNPPAQNVGASDSTAAAISALREQTIQMQAQMNVLPMDNRRRPRPQSRSRTRYRRRSRS